MIVGAFGLPGTMWKLQQFHALEGNLHPLDRIVGELDDLLVVGDAAAVEVALLVVGLEHRMLGGGELCSSAIVKLDGGLLVTGFLFFLRDALHPLADVGHAISSANRLGDQKPLAKRCELFRTRMNCDVDPDKASAGSAGR